MTNKSVTTKNKNKKKHGSDNIKKNSDLNDVSKKNTSQVGWYPRVQRGKYGTKIFEDGRRMSSGKREKNKRVQ